MIASMGAQEILKSARLISKDAESGFVGYNLAAVMLLGRDDVINDACPAYRTDALLRKVNTDRYDDRLIVETNLIESYDLLMGFAEKHLLDKFYMEDGQNVSLRGKIAREMLVNTLMHREFTSSYIAMYVIERDKMTVSNANRAEKSGEIEPDDFQPNPKNPIIASFFRNIGFADQLGSGVRNLYKYSRRYSGQDPQLIDGDIFKIIVPLDDEYSFDAQTGETQNKTHLNHAEFGIKFGIKFGLNDTQQKVVTLMLDNPQITAGDIADKLSITKRQVEVIISKLKSLDIVKREGARKSGHWVIGNPKDAPL